MIRTVVTAAILSIFCLPEGNVQARAYDEAPSDQPVRGETAAIAPGPSDPSPQPGAPHRLDGDGDGMISRAEAAAYYGWLFGLLDRDGDGIIHAAEFVDALSVQSQDPERLEAQRAHLEGLYLRLDSDGDGAVYRDHFLTACGAHFSLSDEDGDGLVSPTAFRSGRPL